MGEWFQITEKSHNLEDECSMTLRDFSERYTKDYCIEIEREKLMGKSVRIIDFDKIVEIVNLGVRRAAVFMGLGLNAAIDPEFKNYQLTDITAMSFMPDDVSEELILEFKEEFGNWITLCGLRELIESYAIFLDEIFKVCLQIQNSKELVEPNKIVSYVKHFLRQGIEGKLERLNSLYRVESKYDEYLVSINQARNCLAHRRGIVGKIDLDSYNEFNLKWLGIEFFITKLDGSEVIVDIPINSGVRVKTNESIGIRFTERKKTFKQGDLIKLSPRDLAEICNTILIACKEISKSAMDYAQSLGIEILSKER